MRFQASIVFAAALALGSLAGHSPVRAGNLSDPASLNEKAPAVYKAKFDTSKGTFVIEVHRDWAPNGADRFYNLVRAGYYDGVRFFRVLPGFMAQFGIHGDSVVSAAWRNQRIPDDPVRRTNVRGMVSFATAGPGTRTTQVFINFGNNDRLDAMGFAPFGEVVEGMEVVDRLYDGYGEGAPRGRGPSQERMQAEGAASAAGALAAEARELAPAGAQVVPLNFVPSEETMRALVDLPAEALVGVIAVDERSRRRLEAIVQQYSPAAVRGVLLQDHRGVAHLVEAAELVMATNAARLPDGLAGRARRLLRVGWTLEGDAG